MSASEGALPPPLPPPPPPPPLPPVRVPPPSFSDPLGVLSSLFPPPSSGKRRFEAVLPSGQSAGPDDSVYDPESRRAKLRARRDAAKLEVGSVEASAQVYRKSLSSLHKRFERGAAQVARAAAVSVGEFVIPEK